LSPNATHQSVTPRRRAEEDVMRADERPRYCVGDRVTLSSGLHAGREGQVLDVTYPNPHVGRARLHLPRTEDSSHPFWNERMTEREWLTTEDAAGMERYLRLLNPPISRRKWLLYEYPLVRFFLPPSRQAIEAPGPWRGLVIQTEGADSNALDDFPPG